MFTQLCYNIKPESYSMSLVKDGKFLRIMGLRGIGMVYYCSRFVARDGSFSKIFGKCRVKRFVNGWADSRCCSTSQYLQAVGEINFNFESNFMFIFSMEFTWKVSFRIKAIYFLCFFIFFSANMDNNSSDKVKFEYDLMMSIYNKLLLLISLIEI